MINMDYRVVDILNSNQLETDDLIGLGDEVVKIISISGLKNGYALTIENDFGERDIIEVDDDETFELYMYY